MLLQPGKKDMEIGAGDFTSGAIKGTEVDLDISNTTGDISISS